MTTPRPWTPKPMWARTPTSWWKIVGPRGETVVASVSEADARLICDAVNTRDERRSQC